MRKNKKGVPVVDMLAQLMFQNMPLFMVGHRKTLHQQELLS
jgi:hypothetical protein